MLLPKDAQGKKFGDIIDNILRPLRIEIAHAVAADTGELNLSLDDSVDRARLEDWLPVAKCIARSMMKSDFPGVFLA